MNAFFVFAAFGLVAAEAAVPRSALGEDDACDAEAGACAVSALQLGSARSHIDGAAGVSSEDRQRQQQQSPDQDDPKWVWPRSVADWQQRVTQYQGKPAYLDLFDTFAPRMVEHCLTWNAYFWPMMSFWSQEVLRRVEALPEDADDASKDKLQKFAQNASYLMCQFSFDPRAGTNWSKPVTEYMQGIKNAPSSDLETPKLDGWFRETETMKYMWSSDACMFWASSLMCDLGIQSRERQGSKGHGDGICWDKVPAPDYGFTVFGVSLQEDRKAMPDSVDGFKHDEYSECMEKPPTKEDLEVHCPMFGHYTDGYMNVTSWGQGYPTGSSQYNEVLTCQAKLDIPMSVGTTPELVRRPWDTNLTLMDPPEDLQAVNFAPDMEIGKAMMDRIFAILRERDAWRAQQYKAAQKKEAQKKAQRRS